MYSYEEIEKLLIGLDEEFSFRCVACGKCCKHRFDIILTPQDLFRISRHFDIEPIETLVRYCRPNIGATSNQIMPVLKTKGPTDNCVFFTGTKCSVHADKPRVCALFPLGRVYNGEEKKSMYMLNPITCGRQNRKVTPRKWMEKFDIPVEDPTHLLYSHIAAQTTMFLYIHKDKLDEEELHSVRNDFFKTLYLGYDISKPFHPQLEERAQKLRDTYDLTDDFSVLGDEAGTER